MATSQFRCSFAWIVIACAFFAGCRSSSLERPLVPAIDDWPTPGRSIKRTSAVDDSAGKKMPSFLWSSSLDAGVAAQPGVVDRTLFVATLKGNVYAYAAETGDELASFKLREPIKGAPAFRDSTMIVALASGVETIQAVNLIDGSVRWSAGLGPIESSPIILDATVVVATIDGTILALDVRNGRELWKHRLDKSKLRRSIRSTPAADQDMIIVAADDGRVLALSSKDGTILWQTLVGSSIVASPVISNGRVFVASMAGAVSCLDRSNGARIWEASLGAAIYETPAVDGDGVFVGTSAGSVVALDGRTGACRWTYSGNGPVTAPVAMNDVVLFGSCDQGVAALTKAAGTRIWFIETAGRVRVAPIVWRKNLVWASDDRLVSCYSLLGDERQSRVSLDVALTTDPAVFRGEESGRLQAGDSPRTNGPDLARNGIRRWSMVASAGTGVLSGVLAATWKAQADRASDVFHRTNDSAAEGEMRKFDTRSAVAFAVMQASTVILTYLLLAD